MDTSMTYPNSISIEEDGDTGSSDSIEETGHTNHQSQCPDTSAIGKKKLPPKATINMPGKKRRLSSEVWDYFDIIPKKDPNDELKCRCKKCGNEYSAESKSGTEKILNFSYMPPPHNGVALAEKIYSLASSWGIERKLFAITLDNASANDSCVAILKNQLKLKNSLICDGMLFHVRCCAHILNLIVQDGLKEIDKSVELIRECVKYVKGSQTRKLRFTECVTQTSLDSKKALVQDVPTRWNSTYRMLSSALYYRLAFCHLQLSDSNFRSCPSLEEWGRVEKICSFLQVFYEATNAFSGSKYPTSNLYFPQVFKIQLKLSEECNSSDDFMKRIASQMFVKFNKYWSEFNLLLAIAVVFDPRYKFQFIEFSYNKLYGPGSNKLVKVRNALFDVYNEYVKISNTPGASSSCSRGSNEVYSPHGAKEQEDNQSFDILEEFDQFDTFEFACGAQKSQLELYLDEPRAKRSSHIIVLDYWKAQQFRFPYLSKLARDILCVPVSTVASESAFSLGGRILDQFRSSLSPQIVEALVCTKDWLFGDKSEGSLNMNLEDLTQNIMSLNINKDEVDATIIEDSNSNVVNL
ncbi:zinc finger BED domain-containing protein RICESLEEPER 2-like [Coffea eugenioides]|uniref:zinc finger BED domain-containing protein RICESLEEPER 2-like n=1 Tax=Coffea eugenioides TaxID=49369 RepID=UPI000F60A862|nr:zinc finger BED domain-containing protein RICESLEEPER 2-like [Coffea eugenioides]